MKEIKKLTEGQTLYTNHRDEPYFTYVKEGKKTIEGRLGKGLYTEIVSGDYIEVCSRAEDDSVLVKVVAVRTYTSFEDMLCNEDIRKVLPDVETIAEGVSVYKQFYTKEQEKQYGVVALEVTRVQA